MKSIKFAIPLMSVVGLVALFALPYVSDQDVSLSAWKFCTLEILAESHLVQAYVVIFGFVAAMLLSAHGILRQRLARWHGVLTFVLSVFALLTGLIRESFSAGFAIGGKVMFIAIVANLALSLFVIIKPEKKMFVGKGPSPRPSWA